jgi:hypothetical protein
MEHMVRPFEATVESEDYVAIANGKLVGETFVVEFFVAAHMLETFKLDTVSVGSDEHGEFAVLSTGKREVRAGWFLSVEPEYDEDFPDIPGCQISFIYSPNSSSAEAEAKKQGIDPNQVNLLIPPEKGISINFNYAGTMDGKGGVFTVGDSNITKAQ